MLIQRRSTAAILCMSQVFDEEVGPDWTRITEYPYKAS